MVALTKTSYLVCSAIGTLLLLMSLSGCGYTFSGAAANRIAGGQSLWVSNITNETVSPTAQTVLRRSLLEEAHRLRGLVPSGSEGAADLRISGVLRSYSLEAISYTTVDHTLQAVSYTAVDHAREYRLSLTVELELRRKGERAPFWKGTIKGHQDFPVDRNNNLAFQRNAEEAALAAASRSVAQKLLTTVEQNY